MTPTPRRIDALYTQANRSLLLAIVLLVLAALTADISSRLLAISGLVAAVAAVDRYLRAYLLWRQWR